MGARTATFLCLASIAGGVMVSKVKRHNATGVRVGPSEALAVRKLASAAETVTKAALDDAMAFGSTRALEDVKQLARVARVAVAGELGMSSGQGQEEDAGEMVKKSISAAATVAGNLVEAHSDAVDSTGDEASIGNAADTEDDEEEAEEAEEAGEEARMESRVRQIVEDSDGSEVASNLAGLAAEEVAHHVASELEGSFGPGVLDMVFGPDLPAADKDKSREVLDKLGEMTSAIAAAAEEAEEEEAQEPGSSAEGQPDGEVKLDTHTVTHDEAARLCGPRTTPFVAFHARTPAVCANYCVPEGDCWAEVSRGTYKVLGIEKQGTCSNMGFTTRAVFAESAPEFFQAFTKTCAGMQMTKWMRPPTNATAKTDELSQDVRNQVTKKVVEMAAAANEAVRELRASLDDTEDADSDDVSEEDSGASESFVDKVADGVEEIVDAVWPVVKPALQDLGEVASEAADAFAEGVEDAFEEEGDAGDEEASEMKKQGESDDEEAGGVVGKVLEGVGEIVDAVAPVVVNFIDEVARDDEEDDEE